MSIKIPIGLEKFEKILQKHDLKQILSMGYSGINVPHDFRNESPSFAAIAKFNGDERMFELFTKMYQKHVGKYGASILMKMVLDNDMGLDLVEELWQDRNVTLSHNFYSAMGTCEEKYIRFFINDKKFLRIAKREFVDSTGLTWLKDLAPRVITIGFENPKVAELYAKIYKETNDDTFLPQEVKDVFVF